MTDLVNEELEVTDRTMTQSVYLCTKWDPVSVYSCSTRPNHLRLFFPISRLNGSNPHNYLSSYLQLVHNAVRSKPVKITVNTVLNTMNQRQRETERCDIQ